jgi:hypothetical protein
MSGHARLAVRGPTSRGVARRSEGADRIAPAGHGFRPSRAAFRRPAGFPAMRPSAGRSRAATLPALACSFRGDHPSPAGSRAPVGAPVGPCFLSWASSALRHTLGRVWCDDRGSRRDPRPRAGFGYPLRGAPHSTSRRAKRRSVLGLLPSGLVLRGRRELLSESLPSWRCRSARRTVWCTRGLGRLQGLALATDPYRRRSLGDRPSLPSWGSPPQSSSPRVRAQRFGRAASPPTPLPC